MDEQQIDTQKEVISTTTSTEPSYLQDSRVKSVLLNYTNWKWTKAEVSDADTKTVLYTIEYKMRKPHLRFHMGQDDNSTLGDATFHYTSTKMDINIRGQSLVMKPRRMLSCDYKFTSPALGNQEMTWKSKSGWKAWDCVLLDEQQLPVAKITTDAWKTNQVCKLDFIGPVWDNEAAKEEILVTGSTLSYYMLTTTMANTSAAAAASSASASSAAAAAAAS